MKIKRKNKRKEKSAGAGLGGCSGRCVRDVKVTHRLSDSCRDSRVVTQRGKRMGGVVNAFGRRKNNNKISFFFFFFAFAVAAAAAV
jgi:hypothetical protein